jgi:hypothetical protein
MTLWSISIHAEQPQACTAANSAGTYSVVCNGTTTDPVTGAKNVPTNQVGIPVGDKSGNYTGFTAIDINGNTLGVGTVSGKATVNPDCTGKITYSAVLHPVANPNVSVPLPPINISFVINPARNEIYGMVTDPGNVVSCTLKSMSK